MKLTKSTMPHMMWKGRRYGLTPYLDGWRLRSRARGDEIDWKFPHMSEAMAKEGALAKFEERAGSVRPKRGTPTLQDVVDVYLKLPKRSGEDASYNNTTRLTAIVRLALGKKLDRVFVHEVGPKLWAAYMAKRLPEGKLDLATRRPGNAAINSAVCSACAIFTKKLRPKFLDAGIEIPENASMVEWLPEMKVPKPPANDAAMQKAWKELRAARKAPVGETIPQQNERMKKLATYYTVGLARFGGLRQEEINFCQRSWIIVKKGCVFVNIHDRPEEGYLHKTGEPYLARIIHPGFAAELIGRQPGFIVRMAPRIRSRTEWFERTPQKWVKPFTGKARMPLHRLRGLYADDVKRITEDAMAAHLAGVKAASKNLGHTSTKTTEDAYLSEEALARR